MSATKKVRGIYLRLVRQGKIKEVPAHIAEKAREKFIGEYAKYDSRLRRINRERIDVYFNKQGLLCVNCVYYRCAYGQAYVIDGNDLRKPTMQD